MSQESTRRPISYLSVAISDDGVAELSGESQVLYLPKSEISAMELMTGIAAERPVAQAIGAAIFIVAGFVGTFAITEWIQAGGKLYSVYIFLLFGYAVGIWLLFGLIRRQTFLRTTTTRGTRKLVFKGKVDHEELAKFIETARQDYRYPIKSSLHEVV